MPKIISGTLKGRKINGFDISGTRPTMDRVKESLFAMINEYLPNSVVLDLFSGSGNLGIEAISNGAKKVYFNDHNKKCINIIKENLNNFNINNQSVITNYDYKVALKSYIKDKISFNLIFLDPPYKDKINEDIIQIILNNHLLNHNGLIICESNYLMDFDDNRIILYKERKYGDKFIYIYKNNQNNK